MSWRPDFAFRVAHSTYIPKGATYQVVILGLVGCGCALLMCIVPYPRLSINQAFKSIRCEHLFPPPVRNTCSQHIFPTLFRNTC